MRGTRITTIAEARELVGRTFERDGKRRTVVRIDDLQEGRPGFYMTGDVFWCRPGQQYPRRKPVNLWDFNDWLAGATEVFDA